jgi:predicted acylesterase/phospholipase RssA/CRP-like cAMP-binding protein
VSANLVEQLLATPILAGTGPEAAQEVALHTRELRLHPGQPLLRQGSRGAHVHLLLEGSLQVIVEHDGAMHVLPPLHAGAVLGELGPLVDGRRQASVVAVTAATVLEVRASAFDRLLAHEPQIAERVSEVAAERLRALELVRLVAAIFPQLDPGAVDAIVRATQWVQLEPGDRLVEEDEPADAAFVIVSGRLRVLVGDRAIGDVGPGELVGEMALLEGGTRTATLEAVRRTVAARLGRDDLIAVLHAHPAALLAVAGTALRRVAGAVGGTGGERRTVALVPLHPTVDLSDLVGTLLPELERSGPARLLSIRDVDETFPEVGGLPGPASARLARWLQEQEQRHDTLLLAVDGTHRVWDEVALRHADHIAFVADAARGSHPTEIEGRVDHILRTPRRGTRGVARTRRSLVLLHPDRASPPRGTARWLDERDLDDWVHVRRHRTGDAARLARILAERPIALVLSGGGARGFAHLGVVSALEEAGVPIDLVCGASMGGVMATYVALDLAPAEQLARARATLQRVTDWTLPLASLVKGDAIAGGAAREVGSRGVEDLWLPWFVVATNLTRAEIGVIRRGPAVKALRATVAIPGLIPPVVYGDELYVDGGVLDNLPVEQMRTLNPRGPVIAVDVSAGHELRVSNDFGLSVSGWDVLLRRLLPGRTPPPVPGIATTLVASMIVGASRERERVTRAGLADLHLEPDLPPCGLLEFQAAERIHRAGYQTSAPRIRDWVASPTALLGRGRR